MKLFFFAFALTAILLPLQSIFPAQLSRHTDPHQSCSAAVLMLQQIVESHGAISDSDQPWEELRDNNDYDDLTDGMYTAFVSGLTNQHHVMEIGVGRGRAMIRLANGYPYTLGYQSMPRFTAINGVPPLKNDLITRMLTEQHPEGGPLLRYHVGLFEDLNPELLVGATHVVDMVAGLSYTSSLSGYFQQLGKILPPGGQFLSFFRVPIVRFLDGTPVSFKDWIEAQVIGFRVLKYAASSSTTMATILLERTTATLSVPPTRLEFAEEWVPPHREFLQLSSRKK